MRNDHRVRWGLLSTARINERLIPCLRRSARSELVAIASRRQETADAYAAHWEIPQPHGSYDALLADPQVDAVYISLPNNLHAEWAVRCADAGKHVLCEKPLALTTAEIGQMMAASERSGVVIQEAAMMRFHAQTDFVRELIAGGTIGEIRLARGLFTFLLERATDIRWVHEMGGGSMWDLGTYCVRWFRTVFGAEPYEVSATQVSSQTYVDASFSGELRFANGGYAHLFSSFASFAHSEADVIGSSGRIFLDMPWVNLPGRDAHVNWAHVVGARKTGTFGDCVDNFERGSRTFEKVDAYQDEVESMASSILDGAPPKISLTDSYNNTAVINALYASAKLQAAGPSGNSIKKGRRFLRTNTVREKLRSGKSVIGCFMGLGSPTVAEMMTHAGFDYLVIETEHNALDTAEIQEMLMAIKGTDTIPLVRIPSANPVFIQRALDIGALGIVVPLVRTAAEAEAIVRATRYPPQGTRSFGGLRASHFTFDNHDYFYRANDNLMVALILETREAIENIEAIAAVPGIDALMFGYYDLCLSYGLDPMKQPYPEIDAITAQVMELSKKTGITIGATANTPEGVNKLLSEGARFIGYGPDYALLANAIKPGIARFRELTL